MYIESRDDEFYHEDEQRRLQVHVIDFRRLGFYYVHELGDNEELYFLAQGAGRHREHNIIYYTLQRRSCSTRGCIYKKAVYVCMCELCTSSACI